MSFSHSGAVFGYTFAAMVVPDLQITARAGARPGHRILSLIGPVSLETAPNFLRGVRSETEAAVILDFTAVPFIDSAGIGALIQSYVHFANSKRKLALVGVNARVLSVLEITRVHRFFPIFANLEEAAARLG